MLKGGILNPEINSLLSRVRHTNTLVIADRGFPSWPHLETIDISLVDDIPRVLDVVRALLPYFVIGRVYVAKEFKEENGAVLVSEFDRTLGEIEIVWEAHVDFKKRIPSATGLIRTGDTSPYANIIIESA